MMKRVFLAAAFGLLVIGQVQAGNVKDVVLDDDVKKFSYTLGYQIAQNLARQGMRLNADAAAKAVYDAFSGGKPAMTGAEMKAVVERIQAKAQQQRNELAASNKKKGEDFLAQNKKNQDVTTTKSGLQYKVLKQGDGKKPKASDSVVAHYEGRLVNGTVFDSSIKRGSPATFPVNGVIKGWQEALQLMPVGSKWQVYIPSELGYGERGAGGAIGPNETLIFDIELIKIN